GSALRQPAFVHSGRGPLVSYMSPPALALPRVTAPTLGCVTSPPSSMRAVLLDAVPAPPEALVVRERPVPQPEPGWVLVEVKAFGVNRSELKTRLGLADAEVTLPRVLGIEAAGVVAACPGGELAVGQQVVAMMGGMGRGFDGGYAEFTCVPVSQVIPFRS